MYKHITTDIEKDRIMDILMTEKHLAGLYNEASMETDCDALHDEVISILKDEHEMQHNLYKELKKRGWYDFKKVDEVETSKLYDEYCKIKKNIGIN